MYGNPLRRKIRLHAPLTVVLFVIRTAGVPWNNRPSVPLMATTIAVVLIGGFLPFSPRAKPLGFVPLPLGFFIFLIAATLIYLFLVELAKRSSLTRLLVR